MENCGKPPMRVFLSGTMDGNKNRNRASFIEAASYLRGQGYQVFNPAFNAEEFCMLRNVHELTEHLSGRAYYDAIAQLPNWDNSPGAKLEHLVAVACGLKVIAV